MENLTHTLAGLAMAKAGLGSRSPFGLPALVVGANLPDVDVFAAWAGLSYLDVHRGVTHGVAGVLALALGTSGAYWGWAKLRGREDVRYLPLAAVTLAGVASHPLLDLLNDYGIRPWLPFDGRWYYGDLVSIADPWLWIVLGAALASGAESRRGWSVLGLVLATLVTVFAGPLLGLAWAAAAVAAYFTTRWLEGRGFGAARVALVCLLVYVGLTALERAVVKDRAERPVRIAIAEPIETLDVLPARPGRRGRWTIVVTTPGRYHIAESGVLEDASGQLRFELFEKQLEHPCYREALADRDMAAMARFARFPSADVHADGARCTVFLRDLRYARRSVTGWGVARAEVSRESR